MSKERGAKKRRFNKGEAGGGGVVLLDDPFYGCDGLAVAINLQCRGNSSPK
jgi:hypothetical protein